MYSINFHEEVSDRRTAESFLIEKPVGSFVTWRTSDKSYCVTYVSPSTAKVSHLLITRHGDDSFSMTEGLDRSRHPTLGELLSGKAYLTHDNPTITQDDKSDVSAASVDTFLGLRQRAAGSATLPAHIKAPPNEELVLNSAGLVDSDYLNSDKWMRAIQPTLTPESFKGVFIACLFIAVGCTGAVVALHARYDASVSAAAAIMASRSRSASAQASSALFSSLLALDGIGPAGPAEVGQACTGIAQTWRASLAALAIPLQAEYDSSNGNAYLGGLCIVASLCVSLALGLQCTHTGRRSRRYTPTEKEYLSGELHEPEGLCSPMQSWWIAAYGSLLASGFAAGFLVTARLWDLGESLTTLQYAAQTLSMEYPADVRAQTGSAGVEDLYATAATQGLWGAAGVLSGVPGSCLPAMQTVVASVVAGPALVRTAQLPQIVIGAISFMLTPPIGAHADILHVRDPITFPVGLRGWLDMSTDTGDVTVVMPSQRAVAHAFVHIVAIILGGTMFLMAAQEYILASCMPAIRRWSRGDPRDRSKAKARASSTPVVGRKED